MGWLVGKGEVEGGLVDGCFEEVGCSEGIVGVFGGGLVGGCFLEVD